MNKCEHCGFNEVKVHLNGESGNMSVCTDCYNKFMADELEVELESLIESFSLKDYQGINRTFIVERRIYPEGIYLEGAENIEFGYKFAVHGELHCNQTNLLNKLIAKARKGMAEQQIKTGVFPNGQEYNSIIHDQFTGLIEYDESSDETPLITIDGKPFTWEEVGKMLMTYEGFQLKVKIYDLTDD